MLLSTHSAATHASFGIVCREIWRRLQRADPSLDIVQHGWYHDPVVETVDWEIVPTLCPRPEPCSEGGPDHAGDCYGDRTFPALAHRLRPDVVWHLADPYMGSAVVRCRQELGYSLVYHYPVAEEPVNCFDRSAMEKLLAADRLVAATRFGERVLRAVPGLDRSRLSTIPLGVDSSLFRPLGVGTRRALRRRIGSGCVGDNALILGWVGHDQFRKQVWVLYELVYYLRSGNWIRCRRCGRITLKEYDHLHRRLRDRRRLRTYERGYDYRSCSYCRSRAISEGEPRPEVVIWTVMENNTAVGWDLRQLADVYRVGDAVFSSSLSRGEAGHTTREMSAVYNCCDLLVYPSGAEGFGMPVLEAMACGVPVVYSDYSGHADYAVGRPVPVRLAPDPPLASMMALIDVGELVRAVLELLDDPDRRRELGRRARRRALRLDWDRLTPRWLELLDSLRRV